MQKYVGSEEANIILLLHSVCSGVFFIGLVSYKIITKQNIVFIKILIFLMYILLVCSNVYEGHLYI